MRHAADRYLGSISWNGTSDCVRASRIPRGIRRPQCFGDEGPPSLPPSASPGTPPPTFTRRRGRGRKETRRAGHSRDPAPAARSQPRLGGVTFIAAFALPRRPRARVADAADQEAEGDQAEARRDGEDGGEARGVGEETGGQGRAEGDRRHRRPPEPDARRPLVGAGASSSMNVVPGTVAGDDASLHASAKGRHRSRAVAARRVFQR